MAVRATPIFIDGLTHPAEETRLAIADLLGQPTGSFSGGVTAADRSHGIVNAGDLAVSQNGTPNMSVNVAAGGCFVRGTESNNQGSYHVWNDATVNVAIGTADGTNPRRDLVIVQVRDDTYSGSLNDARITVVQGTAAASPSDPSLSAYPNALVLARVAVAANDTSITTAEITDLRPRASALGGVAVCTSTRRPASPNVGEMIYETDTGKKLVYYGATTGWQPPWNQPWGQVGYATTTSDSSATATTTDWSGLSVTWTALNNRLYRTIAYGGITSSNSTGSDYAEIVIANSANTQLAAARAVVQSVIIEHRSVSYLEGSVSGSQTRKVRVRLQSGTGNITGKADSTRQASILVEDLGPTSLTSPTPPTA